MKKLFKYLAVLFLILPLFATGQNADAAETDSVAITLHKIIFPDGDLPEESVNSGTTSGTHADLLQDYRGLNGVTFEAYDVTAAFYELRAAGKSVEEAQLALSQLADDELGTAVASKVTATADGEDGAAAFSLPAKSGDKDAVYLFHEADAPAVVAEKSKNLVVVLPLYTDDDALMTDIHLYPKNEEVPHEVPPFEKTVVGKEDSYQFGDVIDYQITTEIPLDILDYQKYSVKDTADESLVFQEGSLTVTAGDKALTEGFDVTAAKNGFTVNFTDLKQLDQFAGQTLTFTYKMQLTADNAEGTAFKNEAVLESDFEEVPSETVVYTGGKHFVKVDLEDNDILLAGAEFVIKNDADKYLVKSDNGYSWKADDTDAIVLTSDEKGQFAINGLAYGSYTLEETKAPAGYQLSKTDVDFEITKNSYTSGAEAWLNVVNLKIPEKEQPPVVPMPEEPTPETPDPEEPVKPSEPNEIDKPEKVYPKTNEVVNHAFVWIGAILIAVVAVMAWQRRKKGNEE